MHVALAALVAAAALLHVAQASHCTSDAPHHVSTAIQAASKAAQEGHRQSASNEASVPSSLSRAPAPPAPPKPVFPQQFTSPYSLSIMGTTLGDGSFYYDVLNSHIIMNVTRVQPVVDLPVNLVIHFNKTMEYIDHNGNCKGEAQDDFPDLFSWVNASITTYAGNATINGVHCDVWKLKTRHANLTLCATATRPVRWLIETISYPPRQTMDFGPLNAGVPKWEIADHCFQHPVCPDGKPTVIDAYVFHPQNTTDDIVNENVADMLGDVLFVCFDATSNNTSFDHYAYVSNYKIEVLSSWGTYQECNGYPGVCIGGPMVPVGREASFAVNENSGQCTDNTKYGNWYSLPQDGLCHNDEPLSLKNNCTWRIQERVKTIAGSCLLHDRGMLKSCLSEDTLPMQKTMAIFSAAFTESDPSKGGCKEVV